MKYYAKPPYFPSWLDAAVATFPNTNYSLPEDCSFDNAANGARQELERIISARDAALERVRVLEAVVKDMQSGFRYVRKRMEYGARDPWYGFGIDRLEKAAANALDGGAA